MKIAVIDLQKRHSVNKEMIKRAASAALRWLAIEDAEINIVLVSDKRIKGLNKVYRKRGHVTDVLAFELDLLPSSSIRTRKVRLAGDVVISLDRACANSRRFSTSSNDELKLYVIHGILHLAGFTDYDKRSYGEMKRIQEKIWRDIC